MTDISSSETDNNSDLVRGDSSFIVPTVINPATVQSDESDAYQQNTVPVSAAGDHIVAYTGQRAPGSSKIISLKIVLTLGLLSLVLVIANFITGFIAGIFVFGGAFFLVPLLILILPSFSVYYFCVKHFLALSRKESIVFSSVITLLLLFGFFRFFSGHQSLILHFGVVVSTILAYVATFVVLWLFSLLIYRLIVISEKGYRTSKFVVGAIIIVVPMVALQSYNAKSASDQYDQAIDAEKKSFYKNITFDPYVPSNSVGGYTFDNVAIITKNKTGVVDLMFYYLTPKGKQVDDLFWIQQYEAAAGTSPAEKCQDQTGDQELYYPVTLQSKCQYLMDTKYNSKSYILRAEGAFMSPITVFTNIGNRQIIIRKLGASNEKATDDLIAEILDQLTQIDKASFFEQTTPGFHINSRDASK